MPATGIEHPPFLPGQYMAARNTTGTAETDFLGTEHEGKEFWFLDYDWSASGVKGLRSSIPRRLRIVRNVSGVNLPPKRLVVLSVDGVANNADYASGSYATVRVTQGPLAYTRAAGIARISTVPSYPVDEFVVSAGVPHGALFYVVVEGPAVCLTDLAGADIATGDWVFGVQTIANTTAATNGVTSGGRITTALGIASTDTPPSAILPLLGRAISSTTAAGSDNLINVRKIF